jgi:mevalonate kinase
MSGKRGFTAETVARVRDLYERDTDHVASIFAKIRDISLAGRRALESGDLASIGTLLKQNQACLRQIGVSCEEIEEILRLADTEGSPGGKLTGSGDGGAVILLPGDHASELQAALDRAGFQYFFVELLAL